MHAGPVLGHGAAARGLTRARLLTFMLAGQNGITPFGDLPIARLRTRGPRAEEKAAVSRGSARPLHRASTSGLNECQAPARYRSFGGESSSEGRDADPARWRALLVRRAMLVAE